MIKVQSAKAWLASRYQATTAGATWLIQKMTPKGPRAAKAAPAVSRFDNSINVIFMCVIWLAFLMFLAASLPHIAYFFSAFEPQNDAGQVDAWYMMIAYGIAGAIEMTGFLLAIKFSRKIRQVTEGLPWYEKFVPAFGVILAYWPFMLLIAGFSWIANFEHAKEFESNMLSQSESIAVNLIVWRGKLGDLNPVLASAFPVLNIAYSFMTDTLPSRREVTAPAPAVTAPAVVETPQVSEIQLVLQAMQEMNSQQLQAIQAMNQQQLETTVQTIQALAGGAARTPRKRLQAPRSQPRRIGGGESQYSQAILKAYNKNPGISASEAGRLAGCSHVTAGRILKAFKDAVPEEREQDTEELEVQL